MREADFFEQPDIRSFPDPDAGRRPFTDAVDVKDRCFVERGTKKGAGGVREMVFAKENLGSWYTEPFLDQMFDPKFIPEPSDHRFPEDAMRAGKHLHARQEQPLELDERLFEKDHIVKLLSLDAAQSQAKIDGMLRKLVVMFLSGKSFFLSRRN
jgi:hypothetical protein